MARKAKRSETPTDQELDEVLGEEMLTTIEKNSSLLNSDNLISSGYTPLDTCMSDTVEGGFLVGRYYLIAGESSAGKTWIAHNVAAEVVHHSRLGPITDIFFDENEVGSNFDVAKFFGQKTEQAIQPPSKNGKSVTVEQFYDNLDRKLDDAEKTGRPFLYVLDSMDGLTTEADQKKVEDQKKAREASKETAGTLGMSKAKVNADRMRKIPDRLEATGSTLIILAQQKIDVTARFPVKTFRGGEALRFYATCLIGLDIKNHIKYSVNGKDRDFGVNSMIRVFKSRLTGKCHNKMLLPILWTVGIDNTGGCLEWLIDEGYVDAPTSVSSKLTFEFLGHKFEGTRETIVRAIEAEGAEDDLVKYFGMCWDDLQAKISSRIQRKSRYS